MTTIINTLRKYIARHEGGEIMLIYANLFISFSFHFSFHFFTSSTQHFDAKEMVKKNSTKILSPNSESATTFYEIHFLMIIKIQRVSAIVINNIRWPFTPLFTTSTSRIEISLHHPRTAVESNDKRKKTETEIFNYRDTKTTTYDRVWARAAARIPSLRLSCIAVNCNCIKCVKLCQNTN